jgi:hypothetical protein
MRNLWLLSEVGLGLRGLSNFVLSYSVAQACGGRIAALLIGKLGRRTFTTISNVCCASAFLAWSRGNFGVQWMRLGILMMLPSINAVNASGIKSMATDLAVAQGMGKGEYVSAYGSLRAFTVFLGPMLYSTVFNSAKSPRAVAMGVPVGAPWIVASLLGGLLPELVHRTMTTAQMEGTEDE